MWFNNLATNFLFHNSRQSISTLNTVIIHFIIIPFSLLINTTQSPSLTLLSLSLSLPLVLRYDTKAKEIHTLTPSPYYIFPSLPTIACSKKTNNFFLPLGGEYVYWFLWQQIYHSCVMGESVLSSLHLLSNHQYYQRKSLIAASNEEQVTSSVLAYTDWLTSASRWHLVQVKADYLVTPGDMLFLSWLTCLWFWRTDHLHVTMMHALHIQFLIRNHHAYTSHALGHCLREKRTCNSLTG